ncbi:MAG: aminopeptidase P family protein [Gammaproteobacteria bacterium]|nr:MAG: aminopeptidase P family protein [Gammaproteobacteria bacterium]UTW41983.1 aminopeptidase P family protein [bacterium SCSIO 12844]
MSDQRLSVLREKMQENQLDYYLVPSSDEHNSEYVPDCWQRRSWISHFTGSAGDALIGNHKAYLWTDGRYFLQAENELDAQEFELMRQSGFSPEIESWVVSQPKGIRLGVDPKVINVKRAHQLRCALNAHEGELVFVEENLVDQARNQLESLPQLPKDPIFVVNENYTGLLAKEKILQVQEEIKQANCQYLILSALDEIAWIFNIRGNDVNFNPVAICYAIIGLDHAVLYINLEKVDQKVSDVLIAQGVSIKPQIEFKEDLASLEGGVYLDDVTVNQWVMNTLNDIITPYYHQSPVVRLKAIKNAVEQKGMKIAHKKDAVAVISFLHWLENNWQGGVSELSVAEKLYQFRLEQEGCQGPSFNTISGFGPHGAIIHYAVSKETDIAINDTNLYLVDSGGQYFEGTTDITRVVHLGSPTDEQKRNYTLVLKGHLALGNAVFSNGTCGETLDLLARMPLWKEGLDYRHGTGHGVGCFLCVHEGPQKISKMITKVPLKPGMVVSNEPGYYQDGDYGIRIENLCLVTDKETTEYGEFYQFQDLTLVPYNLKLINKDLLSAEEIKQVNAYHQRIRDEITPLIKDQQIKSWLMEQTEAI